MKHPGPPKKLTLVFEPDNVSIRVDKGANLLEAALEAGEHINATCGGQGVCGKCRVMIKAGEVESEKTEKISQQEYEEGLRQACRSRPGILTLTIIWNSRATSSQSRTGCMPSRSPAIR